MNEKDFGKIIPLEKARAERLHREAEQQDPYAADMALAKSLLEQMHTEDVYDLLVVERVRETIKAFQDYIEVFELYRDKDMTLEYMKMLRDLSEALAQYERRA